MSSAWQLLLGFRHHWQWTKTCGWTTNFSDTVDEDFSRMLEDLSTRISSLPAGAIPLNEPWARAGGAWVLPADGSFGYDILVVGEFFGKDFVSGERRNRLNRLLLALWEYLKERPQKSVDGIHPTSVFTHKVDVMREMLGAADERG